MSPLGGSRSGYPQTAPAKLPGVIHHEWRGRLNTAKETRKTTESQLHTLLNRISLLEEAEQRTQRALLRTRQKVVMAETLRSTLPALSPAGGSGLGIEGDPSGLSGYRPMTSGGFSSPIRPTTSFSMHSSQLLGTGPMPRVPAASFGARPVSPVRASGYALPGGGGLGIPDERFAGVLGAARTLKETQLAAEREARAVEAAALRAEKDVRLALVNQTRHMIWSANKGMHDGVATAAEEAREMKRRADAEAEARRRADFESRVAAEEAARAVAESRMRQLADIESRVLDRLRSSPTLRLDTIHAPGSPTASGGIGPGASMGMGNGGMGSPRSMAGMGMGMTASASIGFHGSSPGFAPGQGQGAGASGRMGRSGFAPGSSLGFGGSGSLGGAGAASLLDSSAAFGGSGSPAASRPGTRASSHGASGTRRRLAQTAGPTYAVF